MTKAEHLLNENYELRLMVAVAYSGCSRLYMGGCETQDKSALPFIDYLRDTPFEIRGKVRARVVKAQAEDAKGEK